MKSEMLILRFYLVGQISLIWIDEIRVIVDLTSDKQTIRKKDDKAIFPIQLKG